MAQFLEETQEGIPDNDTNKETDLLSSWLCDNKLEYYLAELKKQQIGIEDILNLNQSELKDFLDSINAKNPIHRKRFAKAIGGSTVASTDNSNPTNITSVEKVNCTTCNGSGSIEERLEYNESKQCSECNGNRGYMWNTSESQTNTCSTCNGKGTTIQECDGGYHGLAGNPNFPISMKEIVLSAMRDSEEDIVNVQHAEGDVPSPIKSQSKYG
eukprot:697101_1